MLRSFLHNPWLSNLLFGLVLTACTSGPEVSTDRHAFTGTVRNADGNLSLQMQTPDGFSCEGAAPAQVSTMIIRCSNGLSAEFIGIDDPGFFNEPVVFRLNNGAIGTATLVRA
jgi:hypothetical protein